MAAAQSYGGRVIFAKELSMIMRFWQYDRQVAVYDRKYLPHAPKGVTMCQDMIFSALCGFFVEFLQIFNCNFQCFLEKSRNQGFLLCVLADIISKLNALYMIAVQVYLCVIVMLRCNSKIFFYKNLEVLNLVVSFIFFQLLFNTQVCINAFLNYSEKFYCSPL